MFNAYLDILQTTTKKKGEQEIIPPYIHEFFNVKPCYYTGASSDMALMWVINALIKSVNGKDATLPKYLVVILDHNILQDLLHFNEEVNVTTIQMVTKWLVRQINTTVRRKRIDLLEKRPGSLSSFATKIIFVKMLRRIGKYGDNTLASNLNKLRPRFNDALNDAVAKIDHYLLTINSCNAYEDYDKRGLLSIRGKNNFWLELDNLLQRFDCGKIKLLPNPKNPPRYGQKSHQHHHSSNRGHTTFSDHRKKHPTAGEREHK